MEGQPEGLLIARELAELAKGLPEGWRAVLESNGQVTLVEPGRVLPAELTTIEAPARLALI
jgi:hypothetical protein